MAPHSGLWHRSLHPYGAPPSTRYALGNLLLEEGGPHAQAGEALLLDHMVLTGAYAAAARRALELVDGATAAHAGALAAQKAALLEAADGFEAALATHSSEVRALVDEALHHLLPLCGLVPSAE